MELEALRKDMVAAMKAKDKVTKDADVLPAAGGWERLLFWILWTSSG